MSRWTIIRQPSLSPSRPAVGYPVGRWNPHDRRTVANLHRKNVRSCSPTKRHPTRPSRDESCTGIADMFSRGEGRHPGKDLKPISRSSLKPVAVCSCVAYGARRLW